MDTAQAAISWMIDVHAWTLWGPANQVRHSCAGSSNSLPSSEQHPRGRRSASRRLELIERWNSQRAAFESASKSPLPSCADHGDAVIDCVAAIALSIGELWLYPVASVGIDVMKHDRLRLKAQKFVGRPPRAFKRSVVCYNNHAF
jgi:hypothetical protein